MLRGFLRQSARSRRNRMQYSACAKRTRAEFANFCIVTKRLTFVRQVLGHCRRWQFLKYGTSTAGLSVSLPKC
jgi:hypothetical protein